MPVYLIRHAHAGSRSAWKGDDDERPLSAKGRAQVEALIERLRDAHVGAVLSSPSARCVETVDELAQAHRVPLERRVELAEGADADTALDLVLSRVADDPVVSSHGDLIPKMLRRLMAAGMKTKDANISQKGSLWVVELNGGRPVRGTYYPPG